MKKILVVDDEIDIAESIASLLESEGYICLVVNDGAEALKKLETEIPDLLIIDVMMPIVTGTEVVKEIRKQSKLKNLPILLMSASKEPSALGDMKWDNFLRKPFDIDELISEVTKLTS